MVISAIDPFPNQTIARPVCRERTTNTPYPKGLGLGNPSYSFFEGFYQSPQLRTSHPVEEVIKNKILQRVLDLVNRFDPVLSGFQHIDPTVQEEAISRLAIVLLDHPFHRVVVEKTPDDSLLVKAQWQGKDVFIDVDFDTEEPAGYEVSITAYDGQETVLSVAGPFAFAFGRLLSLTQQPA